MNLDSSQLDMNMSMLVRFEEELARRLKAPESKQIWHPEKLKEVQEELLVGRLVTIRAGMELKFQDEARKFTEAKMNNLKDQALESDLESLQELDVEQEYLSYLEPLKSKLFASSEHLKTKESYKTLEQIVRH